MNLLFMIFLTVYVGVLAYTAINLYKSREIGIELPPAAVRRHARHSATKLRVFGRMLKITLLNITTTLILLSIITSSLIAAAAYSDIRTEFTQSLEEPVQKPTTLIKLSEPVLKHDVVVALSPTLEKAESVTYLYRATLERGVSIEGLPGIKWVIIGIDGELLSELNISKGEIVTGCQTFSNQTWHLVGLKTKCAQDFLYKLRITPLETLLPVLGYIGMEPITPSLDLVVISDIETITRILNFEGPLVSEVVLTGAEMDQNIMKRILETLDVDTLQHFSNSTVLILGSVRIMTQEAAISTLLVALSCVIVVAAAYRSLLPEFKTLNERLHYVGLPLWGATITLLMHIAVAVSLGAVISSVLASYLFSTRQAVISIMVSLFSGFLAALTLVRELGTGTISYGSYTPTVERHELIFPLKKVGKPENLVDVIRRTIETNEFFELEEFEYRLWENEVVVYCRANFKEMWGVVLSGLIAITPLDGNAVKVFIETDVSGVEEVSENIANSIRALFVSKLIGKLKILL